MKKTTRLLFLASALLLLLACPQPDSPGSDGESGGSSPVILPEVSNLTLYSGDGSIEIEWSAPVDSSVTGFTVTADPAEGSLTAPVNLDINQISYTVSSLTNGTTYSITVCTVDEEGRKSSGITDRAKPEADIPFGGGSGTEADPFLIGSIAHLEELRENVNSGISYENLYFALSSDINLAGVDWTPIGLKIAYNTYNCFSGTLDGNNHTIRGLNINAPTSSNIGLFSRTEGAVFKNIIFEDCSLTAKYYAGLLVGYAVDTRFDSCTNNSDLSLVGEKNGAIAGVAKSCVFTDCINNGDIAVHDEYNGGICGYSDYIYTYGEEQEDMYETGSTFTDCTNSGAILCSDSSYSGGILGGGIGILAHCINNGTVTALTDGDDTPSWAGGIAGHAYRITDSVNYGNITGCDYSAGIAATADTVKDCINEGYISDESNIGGICCDVDDISGCVNYGTICGDTVVGGVTARGTGMAMSDCHNFGAVSGSWTVGGVTGYVNSYSGDLQLCTNSADVAGRYKVGGICGTSTSNCLVSLCVNTGKVTATATDFSEKTAGGISGYAENGEITNCLNAGEVEAQYAGGIAGDADHGTITGNINVGRMDGSRAYPICYKAYQGTVSNNNFDAQNVPDDNGSLTTDLTGTNLEAALGTNWDYGNGRYPIPAGLEDSDTAILASAPVLLDSGDDVDSISLSFAIGISGGIVWTSSDESIVSVSGGSGTVGADGTATLTGVLNGSIRKLELTVEAN